MQYGYTEMASADFLETREDCILCGSKRIAFDLVIHYWRENPLRFFKCEDCEARFANPMPSTRLLSDGNSALVRWYQRDRKFEHEFRDARQAYLRGRLLGRKLSRWKKSGHLLDLGCYNGFLPLGIRDHSEWKPEGLEIAPDLSNFINQKLGIPCHTGTLESAGLKDGAYDFVVCHDLIEHINDPQPFLAELARITKRGGRVQIITPNGRQDLAFARRADRQGTPMTMLLNHILFFNPSTLMRALEKAGFRVVKLHGYDVRYALKDFGCFGMGKPGDVRPGPQMKEALQLPIKTELWDWSASQIAELRTHPKTSAWYGFWRESVPKALTLKVPARLAIGHEIYALAEKI